MSRHKNQYTKKPLGKRETQAASAKAAARRAKQSLQLICRPAFVHLPLLVVDGYNALMATKHYTSSMGEASFSPSDNISCAQAQSSRLHRNTLVEGESSAFAAHADPFDRARERLISDVAAFAQGSYEAVVVFDGTQNLSSVPAVSIQAGICVVFSRNGETADSVIERLVTQEKQVNRKITLITSDNTIRSTVGDDVTKLTSALLLHDVEQQNTRLHTDSARASHQKMTVESRVPKKTRDKLWKLLGDLSHR